MSESFLARLRRRLRRHRVLRAYLLVAGGGLAALWIGHLLLGPWLLRLSYDGTPVPIIDAFMVRPPTQPFEHYLEGYRSSVDRFLGIVTRVALAGALLGVGLAAATVRRVAAALALAALGLGTNAARIGLVDLERAAARRIERSAELAARARHHDPARALASIPTHPANGTVLHLADALLGSVAPDGAGGEPGLAPRLAFELDGPDGPTLIDPVGDARPVDGLLRIDATPGGWLESRGHAPVALGEIGVIEIRARHSAGRRMELAWSADPRVGLADVEDPNRVHRVTVDTVPDGAFHRYRIDATRLGDGTDRIARLLVRPSTARGDVVEIDHLRLLPAAARFAGSGGGRMHVEIAGELRDALYVHAPRVLRATVDVPRDSPRLAVGLAVAVPEAAAARFRIAVAAGGERRVALERELAAGDRWTDARVDLAAWAGRRVELELAVEATPGTVALWSSPTVHTPPAERLDVIVILEDTERADRMSIYGAERETTPRRAAFFADGAVFERAYSQATMTRPSVPTLMTSLLPSATGVLGHHDRLADGYVTLAELLRAAGFLTASFVQNGNAGPASGLEQGFEQLFGRAVTGDAPEGIYGPTVLGWMAAHADRNRFLYLHLLDPHAPYDPPPDARTFSSAIDPAHDEPVRRDGLFDPAWVVAPGVEDRRARYDDELHRNDLLFGRFVDALAAMGTLERTIVVQVSDHGEHLGEHGLWGHVPPGIGAGLHVPLLVRDPRGGLPAARVSAPAQLIDVVPTILELLELPTDELLLAGDSLVGAAREPEARAWRDRIALSEEVANRHEDVPGAWGSVFFRDWQIVNSRTFLGLSRSLEDRLGYRDFDELALGTRVYDRGRPADAGPSPGFALDPLVKWRFRRLMRAVRANDEALHHAIEEASARDDEVVELDPDTQEQLRAMGYLD